MVSDEASVLVPVPGDAVSLPTVHGDMPLLVVCGDVDVASLLVLRDEISLLREEAPSLLLVCEDVTSLLLLCGDVASGESGIRTFDGRLV